MPPAPNLRTRQLLKFLHELGTAGLMGAAVMQLIMSLLAEGRDAAAYALARQDILLLSQWVLIPSLLVVLLSGLAAMAIHPPFHDAGWVLTKAAMTILILEGTLFAVQGPAQNAAKVAAEIAAGDRSHQGALPGILRHERGGLGVLIFLSTANVALAVWRPRLRRHKKKPATDRTDASTRSGPEGDEVAAVVEDPVAEPIETA